MTSTLLSLHKAENLIAFVRLVDCGHNDRAPTSSFNFGRSIFMVFGIASVPFADTVVAGINRRAARGKRDCCRKQNLFPRLPCRPRSKESMKDPDQIQCRSASGAPAQIYGDKFQFSTGAWLSAWDFFSRLTLMFSPGDDENILPGILYQGTYGQCKSDSRILRQGQSQ